MGIFQKELLNVIEWVEHRDDVLFWKWTNAEIKKGSRLIIRPGQDAIFMANGKIEGVFEDEGSYDIETEIIPFLSTLKGFKFGFNSGMRAEVLFINTKEFNTKWGTKNAINIPTPALPGGMPIRAFGTCNFKISDRIALIDKIAGVKNQVVVEDIKERIMSRLDQLIMKWIAKEGKDMFNLQINSFEIGNGVLQDLDMELNKIGITVTGFNISSFSYPENVQKMQEQAAAASMVGDVNKYAQVQMAEGMRSGEGGGTATNMAGMMMGMQMASQMVNQMNQPPIQQAQPVQQAPTASNGEVPKFCPNCGTPTNGMKFCGNCGTKLA